MKDNNREWYTTYHREAATTDDIKLCRELYEERIKTLEEYNRALEADLELLRMEYEAEGIL